MSEETLGLISFGLLGPLAWSSWRVWNSWALGASWYSDMRGSSFRVGLVRWMRMRGGGMYWEGGLVWGELRKAIQSFRLRLHSDLPPQRTSSPGTPGLRQRGRALGAGFSGRSWLCPSDF